MKIRWLERGDVSVHSEFFPILNQLSPAKDWEMMDFASLWKVYLGNQHITTLVAEKYEKIIGTGAIMIEHKFLRGGGKVGHIEDVVVDNRSREKGVGRAIISSLVEIARKEGCYKVILNCSDDNIPFYIKCGFRLTENEMRLDL
jgi:glucosamine-phosphate N-acetyltransferase